MYKKFDITVFQEFSVDAVCAEMIPALIEAEAIFFIES